MPVLLGAVRWGLPVLIVVAAALAWWHWTPGEPASTALLAAQPDAEREQPVGVEVALPDGDSPVEAEPPQDRIWETVKSVCPWPPLPSSWQILDEPCLSAMNKLKLDNGWRRVLADPLGTRRAVAEALARHDCRTVALANDWPGETRPDLREACGSGAMVRLAELQGKCVERLHTDWETLHVSSQDRIARTSRSQEDYHRRVDRRLKGGAHNYWETYMCRTVPPEAFEWIEALPVPPGDPTAHRHNRPPITQALDLYDAARRLGADIPDWALGRLELEAEIRERREQARRRAGKGVESRD
ncbi:MAG: hypothetical protein OXL38_11955 [Gammaproteobacteria bacterium]|nr:hypothetical protein [Gammaproteobacteria bacterium]